MTVASNQEARHLRYPSHMHVSCSPFGKFALCFKPVRPFVYVRVRVHPACRRLLLTVFLQKQVVKEFLRMDASQGRPLPGGSRLSPNTWSLDQPEFTPQTASRSVNPFWHRLWLCPADHGMSVTIASRISLHTVHA